MENTICMLSPDIINGFECYETEKYSFFNLNNLLLVSMPLLLCASVSTSLLCVHYGNIAIQKLFERKNNAEDYKYRCKEEFRTDPPYKYKFLNQKLIDIVKTDNETTDNETTDNEDAKTETKKQHNATHIFNTPLGNVAISYDYENNKFLYWSQNSVNRFILDTVARQYIQQTNQYELYSIPDYITDYIKNIVIPFENIGNETSNIEETEDTEETEETETKNDKDGKDVKSNTFLYMGNIRDIDYLQSNKYTESKPNYNMSFADFKNKK